MKSLALHAIELALKQKWQDAIATNEQILSQNPSDLDALKRIGYAYLQKGNIKQAKKYYHKVLNIDKYNPIALKTLKRIDCLTEIPKEVVNNNQSTPAIFLEEPGKTKVINLINLASNETLCHIAIGQQVDLIAKKRSIEIRLDKKTYIGVLPDDISHRLIRLCENGNKYDAYIKHIGKNEVSVFVREVKKGKLYQNMPSFVNSTKASYIPFVRKSLSKEKDPPNVSSLEETES